MHFNMKKTLVSILGVAASLASMAQNPYLPLWEYIPDGEPYVFEDPDHPGKYRLYVYGSHDDLVTEYCGRDQVVWSAPVDNLTDWRYDGVVFTSERGSDGSLLDARQGRGDVLYAPDVATVRQADGSVRYYFYPNNQSGGRQSMVCVSDRPDGPFKVCNWNGNNPRRTDGVLGFDPAVFVDDDGRVYGYWGFEESNGAELDPENMASVKPGTEIVRNMVSDYKHDGVFRFFEASSMRKIEDKYVFIYSRYTEDGEFGLPRSNNTLAYAYSDNPLGPFTYGGTLVDARARGFIDGKPAAMVTPYGNTHGSIVEIDGQWWVFYHRQTGTDQFSRQAMVAPITVSVEKGKGGKVVISEAEVTSEGFQINGLNPLERISAGWACLLTNPGGVQEQYPNFIFTGSYVQPTRIAGSLEKAPTDITEPLCPVVNNTPGSAVGFKYLDFNKLRGKKVRLEVRVKPMGKSGWMFVDMGTSDRGIAKNTCQMTGIYIDGDMPQEICVLSSKPFRVSRKFRGKQPVTFMFYSNGGGSESLCDFYDFQFVKE